MINIFVKCSFLISKNEYLDLISSVSFLSFILCHCSIRCYLKSNITNHTVMNIIYECDCKKRKFIQTLLSYFHTPNLGIHVESTFYLPNFWVKRIKKKIEISCPIFLSFLITKNIFINKVVFEESYKTFLGFTFRIFVLKILKKDEIFTKFFPTSFLHPCVYIKHFHYSNFIHLYLNFTCLSVCLLICYW